MIFKCFICIKLLDMIPIKNNIKRANAARIIFYSLVAMSIISFYSHFLQYQLLIGLNNGLGITAEMASENNTRQQVVAFINLILLLTSIVVFLIWVYRAYDNLDKLGITRLSCTPGWAVGYWFVPIMSLFKPFIVMKEIWDETQGYVLPEEEKHTATKSYTVGIWWTFYIINATASYALVFATKGNESTPDGLMIITKVAMFTTIFALILKIITLIMINKIVIYESRLFEFVKNRTTNQSQETISF